MNTSLTPFVFDGREVRTVLINGEPWFITIDLCAILGFSNSRKAVTDHVDSEDRDGVTIRDAIGRRQRQIAVNESGLYALIFGSSLPDAKRFKRWVTHEVLPSIRKTGRFSVDVPFLVPVAQPWTKTFDDEFYAQIFRLKGKPVVPKGLAPWLAQVTNDLIYRRLPEGVFDALQLINPVLPGRKHRRKKQHQFVEPTVARRHLDRMLDRCTGMMAGFLGWNEFYASWNRLYRIERDLPGHLEFKFADDQTLLFPFMLEEAR
jgi:prophage antirepressor-like protein